MFSSISDNIIHTKSYAHLKQNINYNLTSKDPLQIDDFQIGGIMLEQKICEVKKIFGEPSRIYVEKEDERNCYEYPGLTIIYSIITGNILAIEVRRNDLKTFRGISVGDAKDKVIYHYGNSEYEEEGYLNYQKYVYRDYEDIFYAITFRLKEEKVSEIMIYFAWD